MGRRRQAQFDTGVDDDSTSDFVFGYLSALVSASGSISHWCLHRTPHRQWRRRL